MRAICYVVTLQAVSQYPQCSMLRHGNCMWCYVTGGEPVSAVLYVTLGNCVCGVPLQAVSQYPQCSVTVNALCYVRVTVCGVTLQAVSQYPQCSNDLSVWLPDSGYSAADFYDLVRSLGGDMVEQVSGN